MKAKKRPDLIPPKWLDSIALTMGEGDAHGYTADEWRFASFDYHLIKAIIHISEHFLGSTTERHLSHAAVRLLMAESKQFNRKGG